MQCPKCKCEMRIANTRTVVTGDQSPDTETHVFTEQDMVCRNAACPDYGQVVETVRNQVL